MSRMVKLARRPTSSACIRRILAPIEWKVPSHGIPCAEPVSERDPLAHLARRLVGEGDGEDLVRPRPARGDEMGDAGGQHPRLADARAGQHQHRPVERLDGFELLGIEAAKIGRKGPRRDHARRVLGRRPLLRLVRWRRRRSNHEVNIG